MTVYRSVRVSVSVRVKFRVRVIRDANLLRLYNGEPEPLNISIRGTVSSSSKSMYVSQNFTSASLPLRLHTCYRVRSSNHVQIIIGPRHTPDSTTNQADASPSTITRKLQTV